MTSTISKTGLKDQINKASERPKHKGGAPQKKIKRASGIRVRLTATEHFLIKSKAHEAGMKISDWFRAAALKAQVVARITTGDRKHLHILSGLANNLNQLAKMANTSGILSIVIKCGQMLAEIDQILKYLNRHDGKDS